MGTAKIRPSGRAHSCYVFQIKYKKKLLNNVQILHFESQSSNSSFFVLLSFIMLVVNMSASVKTPSPLFVFFRL